MSASNAWFHALLAAFANTADSAASPTRSARIETPVRPAAVPAPQTTPSVGASIVKGRTSPATVFVSIGALYAAPLVGDVPERRRARGRSSFDGRPRSSPTRDFAHGAALCSEIPIQ